MPAPPLPLDVVVETSLGCNLRCPMCDQHRTGLTQQRRTMDPALRARLSREALPHAARLGLTVSGEPLMDPDLSAWLRVARRTGVKLSIASNGTVLPREDDALVDILRSTASMMFSIDSLDRATFAAIRGRDVLPQVRANLERVVRLRKGLRLWERPRLGLSVVWMRHNLHELGPLIALASKLGLDVVSVAHLTVHEPALDALSLRHCAEEADTARALALEEAARRGVSVDLPPAFGSGAPVLARGGLGLGAGGLLRRLRHRVALSRWRRGGGDAGGCPFLESRAYVSIDGLVSPCCMPGRPIMGDLRTSSWQSIWAGAVAQGLRRALAEGRPVGACAHCSVHRQGAYRPDDPATVVPALREGAGGGLRVGRRMGSRWPFQGGSLEVEVQCSAGP